MADTGYIEATDKIVLAGERSTQEREIETVADMIPGVLVKAGSTNNEIVVNTAGAVAQGWLGYEDTAIPWRPATIDTIYVVNDRAAVVSGPGMVLRAKLANGTNISQGDRLVGTAAGALKIWIPVPIDAASAEEDVVAIAMEDKATTGSEVNIIVRSLI